MPFGGDQQLNQFVNRLGIRRKDFPPELEHFSERLVEHAKSAAAQADAPYHYLQGRHSEEKLIDQSIRERKLTSGLIAALCLPGALPHGQALVWRRRRCATRRAKS